MTIPSIKYRCPKCGKETMSITDSCNHIPHCFCTLKWARDKNGVAIGKPVSKCTRMKRVK